MFSLSAASVWLEPLRGRIMSLRVFHFTFAGLASVLSLTFSWVQRETYQLLKDPTDLAISNLGLAVGIALAVYGLVFLRKTRRLSE